MGDPKQHFVLVPAWVRRVFIGQSSVPVSYCDVAAKINVPRSHVLAGVTGMGAVGLRHLTTQKGFPACGAVDGSLGMSIGVVAAP